MIDNLEPLRIPGFRVLETGETGETHAIFEKNFSMVRTNMDNLIINYTHVVHYNGRVWDP